MENDIELQAQDVAMHSFLKAFPFPLTRVIISDDGMQMTYRLRGSKRIDKYLEMARLTIFLSNLPLTAKRDTFKIGDVVFQDDLQIIFEPAKMELPCY